MKANKVNRMSKLENQMNGILHKLLKQNSLRNSELASQDQLNNADRILKKSSVQTQMTERDQGAYINKNERDIDDNKILAKLILANKNSIDNNKQIER